MLLHIIYIIFSISFIPDDKSVTNRVLLTGAIVGIKVRFDLTGAIVGIKVRFDMSLASDDWKRRGSENIGALIY